MGPSLARETLSLCLAFNFFCALYVYFGSFGKTEFYDFYFSCPVFTGILVRFSRFAGLYGCRGGQAVHCVCFGGSLIVFSLSSYRVELMFVDV